MRLHQPTIDVVAMIITENFPDDKTAGQDIANYVFTMTDADARRAVWELAMTVAAALRGQLRPGHQSPLAQWARLAELSKQASPS